MLYKKNTAPALDRALFQNPTAEYRGTPFWAWNCALDVMQLLHQIDAMKQMGFGGFHMHSRTGLDTPYMGPEFMAAVRACCQKAEKEHMLAWLYDEDRWSSGTAGGQVTKDKRFRRKRLELFPRDMGWTVPKAQALEAGVPYLLGCYDITLDGEGYLASYRRIEPEAPAAGTKWYAYAVNEKESSWFNGQTYFDAMNAEAVGRFIELTHEKYHEAVGEYFGTLIPAIFMDEPNTDQEKSVVIPTPEHKDRIKRAWSRFFEEEYRAAYGEDILDRLPELIWCCRDGRDGEVKYRYHDLKAALFSENCCGQIGRWCEAHGIAFTGHLLREPELATQAISCGETMRCYGKFTIPGIDILCNLPEYTTAKQTQSAVHQYGKEGMLSEIYGVTDWTYDFRGHKLQGDWQAALGVTVRVPHLSWVSMKGEAKRDYPAAIGYQSPWYREYSYIENHFARLNTALTRGAPLVNIGVIHPVESYWLLAGPASQNSVRTAALEESFKNVTQWLLESHLDFDFICESTLHDLTDGTPGRVGCMTYDAIVVPGCLSLRQTTLDFLRRFAEAGGRLVFLGGCPDHVDGVQSDGCRSVYDGAIHADMDRAALTGALEDVRTVSLRAASGREHDAYFYNFRQDGDCRWLFTARCRAPGASFYTFGGTQQDVLTPETLTVRVRGEFAPEIYDTLTGDIRPVSCAYREGWTEIPVSLHGCDSLLLRLGSGRAGSAPAPKTYAHVWRKTVRGTVNYSLSEPNVLLLDQAQWALDGGKWQDTEELLRIGSRCRELLGYPPQTGIVAQPYTMKKEPPDHTLHLRFTFESELAVTDAALALEDAETASIRLNGEAVNARPVGYFTDEAIRTVPLPPVPAGKNVIDIDLPYGRRTFVEWCYLLGDFAVRVAGTEKTLTKLPEKLGFSDITAQGFPFYGANVTYHIPVTLAESGTLEVRAPVYRGALLSVSLDGADKGRIVFPPYTLRIPEVPAGDHTVSLTVFGNRYNSFGALHMVNSAIRWIGPNVWRTQGDDWCYEYRTKPFGLLKGPETALVRETEVEK